MWFKDKAKALKDGTLACCERHPALTGAVSGAAVGSAVPFVGTVIGAVSGATIGYYIGKDGEKK